ncbi:LAMI_0F01310g1_1 [Lachancea mirantina]|uniref:LAMI_0F01310g1_1 n=1 Tax=Lachancea mirantina TaxID=1230905 RepID=A0A1G4JW22_9SACH|nr:LAMI_0F01310g1_1 [Lachancea mirantina]
MDQYQGKIGAFIQIPNVGRGQLKYVGPVEGKTGVYVGVDLLANIGKNDGSFDGKRYFQTEYVQSGLFIQLQKVAALIDEAANGADNNCAPFDTLAQLRRQEYVVDPRSPTPVRYKRDEELGLEPMVLQQRQELQQYKSLIEEQRGVLEDIQPAIEDYETRIRSLETELDKVRNQLSNEREQWRNQKLYFETEHEQLLSVVEELHREIRENERRMIRAREQAAGDFTSTLTLENDPLREGVQFRDNESFSQDLVSNAELPKQ